MSLRKTELALATLRYHVTGAIERGEAVAISGRPRYRKGIAYSYANSPNAISLGMSASGCHHLFEEILREDGSYSPSYLPHIAEGYPRANDPDLLAQLAEARGELSPWCSSRFPS